VAVAPVDGLIYASGLLAAAAGRENLTLVVSTADDRTA